MTTLDSIRDVLVYQHKNGYRFSLDALLLFSFVSLKKVSRICDLGAGSGIIGLLLARRYPHALVTLVELQEGLYLLAERNIALNGLQGRVTAVKGDIADIPTNPLLAPHGAFDLVISNPPFRRPGTGLLSRGDERSIARHEIRLSIRTLITSASLLLRHHGRFCMIHLPERLPEIIKEMTGTGLEPKRLRLVHSTASSEAKMVLLEGVKGGRPGLSVEKPLCVYNEDGAYSAEIRALQGETPAS